MKVLSTLVSEIQKVEIDGVMVKTGMYKQEVDEGVFIQAQGVKNDSIADLVHHGGEYQAVYIFGKNNYPYFEEKFPEADWNPGIFGENVLIESLVESELNVGDIFSLGDAKIQITIPRQPCSKFGYRLKSKQAIKAFANHSSPGVYARVIKEGWVKPGDRMELTEPSNYPLSILSLYQVMMNKSKNQQLVDLIVNCPYIPNSTKDKFK